MYSKCCLDTVVNLHKTGTNNIYRHIFQGIQTAYRIWRIWIYYQNNYFVFYFVLDVLNVSGRFNTKDSTDVVSVGDEKSREPYFEVHTTDGNKPGSPQNVSALIGKTAFLSCVVKNLGKSKSVSELNVLDSSNIIFRRIL